MKDLFRQAWRTICAVCARYGEHYCFSNIARQPRRQWQPPRVDIDFLEPSREIERDFVAMRRLYEKHHERVWGTHPIDLEYAYKLKLVQRKNSDYYAKRRYQWEDGEPMRKLFDSLYEYTHAMAELAMHVIHKMPEDKEAVGLAKSIVDGLEYSPDNESAPSIPIKKGHLIRHNSPQLPGSP